MNIKEMRKLLGLTQAAFSEKYKIPKRTIEDWESERRTPPVYVLYLLERVVTDDYNKANELEKYAIESTSNYVMQLDEELNEQETINNRFL